MTLWDYSMITEFVTTLPESAASLIGHITLKVKLSGKRSAGNPQAAFDEAGFGNGSLDAAPDFDPTGEACLEKC